MLAGLDALAGVTGFDILSDFIVHAWPVETIVQCSVGAFDALVSRDWGVVMVMEDLSSEWAFRDANPLLVIFEDAILS